MLWAAIAHLTCCNNNFTLEVWQHDQVRDRRNQENADSGTEAREDERVCEIERAPWPNRISPCNPKRPLTPQRMCGSSYWDRTDSLNPARSLSTLTTERSCGLERAFRLLGRRREVSALAAVWRGWSGNSPAKVPKMRAPGKLAGLYAEKEKGKGQKK